MADTYRYYTNPVIKGLKGMSSGRDPWQMLAGAITGIASGLMDNMTMSNQERIARARKRATETLPTMAGGMEQNAVMPKLSEMNYG